MIALLPTKTNIRPTELVNEYFDSYYDGVLIIRSTSGKMAAIPVATNEADITAVGTSMWDCRHDQAGYRLGDFTVVGIARRDAELNRGEIPTRKIPFWVFK